MKKVYRGGALALSLLIGLAVGACGGEEKKKASAFSSIAYTGVETVTDLNKYHADVTVGSIGNDDPVDNGIINCLYYSLEINGKKVPVYTTRCAQSLHSFAWVDATEVDGEIILDVEISTEKTYESVLVLPESRGVEATLKGQKVNATVNGYGSFSFVFDKGPEEALTLYVAPKEALNVPEGWKTETFDPGKYTQEETNFTESNTAYVFKAGRYELSSVNVPSDSILYFEPGTYVEVYSEGDNDRQSALKSHGTKNVTVAGRALFDFSASQGGDAKIKGVYSFNNVDGASFSGVTTINSNNWSLCFTDSNDVEISRCMFFGYRTYSDGIMLSDCQDSGAKYCFVRTGDDAIETKSTGTEYTENILYEYNAVWTDKARGYGVIYEANHNKQNVTFRNCSIGFALPTWSDYLGCCCVSMGDNKKAVWQDIYFENIEVYKNDCALLNITLKDDYMSGTGGGQAKNIYFSNVTSKRCYGVPLRINVQAGGTLGQVFLDNIRYNGKTVEEGDINDKDILSIANVNSGWSKTRNVKINTLG